MFRAHFWILRAGFVHLRNASSFFRSIPQICERERELEKNFIQGIERKDVYVRQDGGPARSAGAA